MIRIIVFYLLAVNGLAFLLFAADKKIAKENGKIERAGKRKNTKNTGNRKPEKMKRRIPEKVTLHINSISRVTIYSLDVLLFLFGTSVLFHVQF